MKCKQIVFIFCAVCVLAVSGETDDHKVNHHSQEKSHQNKRRNEKSHILNRHKDTETRIHSSSYFKHLAYRDGIQHCRVVCNYGSPSNATDIQILYNGDAGLIAYLNQSANIAVIQDYSSNITVVLNGQAGTAIVENIGKEKYYSLEKNAQTEEVLWISSKTDFNAFFKNLTSLQKFVKIGEEHGKAINGGEDLVKAKTPYFVFLDFKASEANFTLSINFMTQLNTTLRFIFKGQGAFTIHKPIIWFTYVNLAFADIFRDSQTQLQSLDLKLNLSRIYEVDSGVEAFINLLTQLGTRVNLANILRNQLSSPEKLLELLAKLSGGSEEGIDGIITVVTTVIKVTNGHASINDVITAILNYKPDGDNSSLTKVVDEALNLIESQNRVFNNSEVFQGIITVLRAINNGNFVYRNINISDILKLLVSRNPATMIQTIIRIFIRFAGSEGFPHIFLEFIQSLNSTNGFNIIRRIFPGFNLDNVRHCISSIFSNIPIIGNIFANSSSFFNISSSIVNSIPVIGPTIVNGSAGIISGIENVIHDFVDPFFGPGRGKPPAGTEPPPPNTGNISTNRTSHPKGTTADTSPSNSSAGTESPKSDRHHSHLYASKRKENVHARHKLQEKDYHGHMKPSNRKENIHQMHQEKDYHHGHLRDSNKNENVHHRHKLHEKHAQDNRRNEIHDKKHEDHYSHH